MTTIMQKWKRRGWDLLRLMEIRANQKIGYFIYEIFYTNLMVTMKQKLSAETQNIKIEEIQKNITENHQNENGRQKHKKKTNQIIEQPENK